MDKPKYIFFDAQEQTIARMNHIVRLGRQNSCTFNMEVNSFTQKEKVELSHSNVIVKK